MTVRAEDQYDFLPDPNGAGGALCYALAVIGAVRPHEVADTYENWQRAVAELDALGIALEEKEDGTFVIAELYAPPPFKTLPVRVRYLVEGSRAWRRAVMRTQLWPVIQEHRAAACDFIASAVTFACDYGDGEQTETILPAETCNV